MDGALTAAQCVHNATFEDFARPRSCPLCSTATQRYRSSPHCMNWHCGTQHALGMHDAAQDSHAATGVRQHEMTRSTRYASGESCQRCTRSERTAKATSPPGRRRSGVLLLLRACSGGPSLVGAPAAIADPPQPQVAAPNALRGSSRSAQQIGSSACRWPEREVERRCLDLSARSPASRRSPAAASAHCTSLMYERQM
jgi:hypothetical protein